MMSTEVNMNQWMTADEVAEYIGISKTNLYALTQEKKIPSSKVGKKLLYEKDQIDEWLRASKTIDQYFIDVDYNIEDNYNLRDPQREGYIAAYNYINHGGKAAILQLPVGCGKSGIISILPFGISKGRVLVITPNLPIKEELLKTLDISNRQKCFWRRMKILQDKDMMAGPYVCTLEEGNTSICDKSHIILTNIHQLATNPDKWLAKFPDNYFDMIINDEAHHTAANSWKKVFEKFPNAKIINLTATPFRSDRQSIDGELIYRYPFKSASLKGYIKKIKACYVAPSELTLTFTADSETKTYTLEEVLKMKEETWFSRGIALSEPCNISIVDNSLEKLEELRRTGTKHQLIACACSIRHAKQIRSLYSERGYETEVIHSQLPGDEQDKIINDLKSGILDCIVQVQMLGEGFDHPKLSVAAIFNPFRSLAPYIQFVGRILRVIVQNDPIHPDNFGFVVTHVGLNLDKQLQNFKDFENDDKKFWESVTNGDDPELPADVIEGRSRKNFNEKMVVEREIVDKLFEEEFIAQEDEDIIKELEAKLIVLGMDSTLAREIYIKNKDKHHETHQKKSAEPFSVNPQRQWVEAKKRLDEEIKKVSLNLYITATAAKAYDKAVVWGEKYLELDPNREDIVKNVSVIYAVALKNNQKSLEVLTKFEEKFKTNTAKLAIADRYDRMKDYNNAIIWYKKAYEQSKDSDLFEKIADLYVKLKQNTEAIKTYEDFLASNPSEADLMKTYRNLGTLYNKLKNTNKAIEYFEKVLAIQPDPKVALFLVSSYYDKKDYSNTIKYANIVIENESSNADAIYFRALAYYYSNKKDLAKADFQQVEKNPKYGKSASDFLKLIAQGK